MGEQSRIDKIMMPKNHMCHLIPNETAWTYSPAPAQHLDGYRPAESITNESTKPLTI